MYSIMAKQKYSKSHTLLDISWIVPSFDKLSIESGLVCKNNIELLLEFIISVHCADKCCNLQKFTYTKQV